MPNDLRDRNFTPYKPSPASKSARNTQADGCLGGVLTGLGAILLIIGIGVLASGGGNSGSWFSLIGVFVLIRGITMASAAGKARSHGGTQTAARPASKPYQAPPQRPAAKQPKPAAKKEECPNPEPHRHYEAAPEKREYDTFVDRNKRWPTDRERRLQNMKNLYDAGLLTREEYDDEVRKIKG